MLIEDMVAGIQKEAKVQQLVFALTQSDMLGIMIEAYVVDLTKMQDFSLSFRKVNYLTIKDYSFSIRGEEEKLLGIISDYSEEQLVKKFARNKNLRPREFFNGIDNELINMHIRPYIERRLVKCLEIFYNDNVKLYFKGKKDDPIVDNPLDIIDDPAKVVFNFTKTSNATNYHLTIKHNGTDISLTNKKAFMLSHKPCWLLLENKIYRFTNEIDSKKLVPFFTKNHIEIPQKSERMYFETFVKNAIKNYDVNATGFDIKEIKPQPEFILSMEEDIDGEPVMLLKYKYDQKCFKESDAEAFSVSLIEEQGRYIYYKIIRNRNLETDKKQLLYGMGLKEKNPSALVLAHDGPMLLYDYINWINENYKTLSDYNITVNKDKLDTRFYTGTIKLDLKINENEDWFDIYGIVVFGAYKIPFIRLKNHIINGKREFKLPNGELAILPEEWFSRYQGLIQFSSEKNEMIRLKKHHFQLINSFKEEKGIDINLAGFKKLDGMQNLQPYDPPEQLNAAMRPYQLEGYSWMYYLQKSGFGGCLADDMGLGKTIQTLALLLKLKKEVKVPAPAKVKHLPAVPKQLDIFNQCLDEKEESCATSLIVMPLSLVHNWKNEISKFTPQLRTYIHTGNYRVQDPTIFLDYDVVLTTYGVIRNDLEMLRRIKFFYLILDESQVIKNPESKIFKSIKQIQTAHRLVLTGTPIENSLIDLWSQLSFLNDGLLGSLGFFKDEFVQPIEKQNDEAKREKLKKLIEPFILRRTKNIVAKDLPALTEKIHYCEMSSGQKKLYEQKKSEIRNIILDNLEKHGREKSSFVILNGLMQLRLIANHPSLIDQDETKESGKYMEVLRSIEKLVSGNHKVLVFSSFVKHLNLFKKYFDRRQMEYSYLTGEVTGNGRQQTIEKFQNDPENRIFLASIKAGGLGLNLTSAAYVFILDPWWNPAVESQAINRAHRIGQDKHVFSYKFISKDSIEEKILHLQQKKFKLANTFVNNNNPFKDFSEEEIKKLFD